MQATLTVPAEYVETFRVNVYGQLEGEGDTLKMKAAPLGFPKGESWHRFINGDPDKIESHAVNVLKATRNIAALALVMEQLGWTDPIEEVIENSPAIGSRLLEIQAAPDVIVGLIDGCIVDVGQQIHDITDSSPFDREAFDATTARGAWLADRRGEVEAVGSA